MDYILKMENIFKSFFGVYANEDVSLFVKKGEIHALLGENGAGKTTLMNILYGIYPKDSGKVFWKGEEVEFHSPKDAIARKIGMVHQHFNLVGKLTVSENITLGLKMNGYPFVKRAEIDRKIEEISSLYGLPLDVRKKVSQLSVGEEQRVEIMKLLFRDVELLILDEPTAVLTPGETKDFFRVLKKLKDDGKSIIIITHRIPEVMEIADMVTVLRDGKVIRSVSRNELSETLLSSLMIGRALKETERGASPGKGDVELLMDNVTVKEGNRTTLSLSLSLSSGEILGVAGVDGNGQKELSEAIVGIRKISSGSIRIKGEDVTDLPVQKRKERGIGYISDDRHRDGLVLDMSLEENMLLGSGRKDLIHNGFIDFRKLREETEEKIDEFAIKTNSPEMPVRYLSGGNQQKLILSREIYDGVGLIVAFQPTRGLDIGASESVRNLLLKWREKGCAILLISADLDEIFSLSDRIIVLHGGRIMGEIENDGNPDIAKLGLMMAGKGMENE